MARKKKAARRKTPTSPLKECHLFGYNAPATLALEVLFGAFGYNVVTHYPAVNKSTKTK